MLRESRRRRIVDVEDGGRDGGNIFELPAMSMLAALAAMMVAQMAPSPGPRRSADSIRQIFSLPRTDHE